MYPESDVAHFHKLQSSSYMSMWIGLLYFVVLMFPGLTYATQANAPYKRIVASVCISASLVLGALMYAILLLTIDGYRPTTEDMDKLEGLSFTNMVMMMLVFFAYLLCASGIGFFRLVGIYRWINNRYPDWYPVWSRKIRNNTSWPQLPPQDT